MPGTHRAEPELPQKMFGTHPRLSLPRLSVHGRRRTKDQPDETMGTSPDLITSRRCQFSSPGRGEPTRSGTVLVWRRLRVFSLRRRLEVE